MATLSSSPDTGIYTQLVSNICVFNYLSREQRERDVTRSYHDVMNDVDFFVFWIHATLDQDDTAATAIFDKISDTPLYATTV
mgnify:CR=1 FL=1